MFTIFYSTQNAPKAADTLKATENRLSMHEKSMSLLQNHEIVLAVWPLISHDQPKAQMAKHSIQKVRR